MVELKKYQLNAIYEIVNSIQLNKITDSKIRKTVLKLVLEIPKSITEFQKDISDTRTKFLEGFKTEDLTAFQAELNGLAELSRKQDTKAALEKDHEIAKSFPEITSAFVKLNESLDNLQNETVEFNVEKINMEEFVDALVGLDVNITAKELNVLDSLFEHETTD